MLFRSGVSRTRGVYVQSSSAEGGNASVGSLSMNNVLLSLHQYGVLVDNDMVCDHLSMYNSRIANCGNGFHVLHKGTATDVSIVSVIVEGCQYGISSNAQNGGFANAGSFTGVIQTCNVRENALKGLYFEKLDHARIEGLDIRDNGVNGTAANATDGLQLNLKFGAYDSITILNNVFLRNGQNRPNDGAALAVAARDDGNYAANPASLTNVRIHGNSISGSPIGIAISNKVSINGPYGDNDAATIGGAAWPNPVPVIGTAVAGGAITDCSVGIVLSQITGSGGTLALRTYDFPVRFESGVGIAIANYASNVTVDATEARFTIGNAQAFGRDLTVAQGFNVADKVVDSIDASVLGRVVLTANRVYVTANSHSQLLGSNATGILGRGVAAAQAGNVVHVQDGVPLVLDRKSTRLNSSHEWISRMPSSA